MKFLQLLQMADSGFPIGGFAFSSGLESALKQGFIHSLEDLQNYINTFSEQLLSFDFPFICSAFESINQVNEFSFAEIQQAYTVMLMNPTILKAAQITGSNWLKIIKQLYPSALLDNLVSEIALTHCSMAFPGIFGNTLSMAGFELKDCLQLFFYMSIRDQASSMIRLSIVGPSIAQQILKTTLDQYEKRILELKPQPFTEAVKSGYLLDLIQLTHNRVYSKLFQN